MGKTTKLKPLRNLGDIDTIKLYREEPCRFFEEQYFCRSALPPYKETLIKLLPYQKEIIDELLLTRDDEGFRLYDEAYISMGKKNDKSGIATKVFLYLFFLGEKDGQYAFVGNNREQATSIAYTNFVLACQRNPQFKALTNISKTSTNLKNAYTRAFPVAYADASNHGGDISGVHFDEGWGYPDDKVFVAFTKNPIRREFLALHTTYAGQNTRQALYNIYKRGKEGKSPSLYFKCFEAKSQKEEDWMDANPAPWITMKYLKAQKEKINNELEFNRLHLNRWATDIDIGKVQRFVTPKQIMAVTNPELTSTEMGEVDHQYVCGVDLGLVSDNTAVAVLHRDDEKRKVILDRLDVWCGTKEKPVDIDQVEQHLFEIYARYRPSFVVDPWQMQGTIQRIRKALHNVRIVEVIFQTKLPRMTQLLRGMIATREIEFYPNAGEYVSQKGDKCNLQTELEDLQIRFTGTNYRFDHDSSGKSDLTTAVAIAVMDLFEQAVILPKIRRL